MANKAIHTKVVSANHETELRRDFQKLFRDCPIPDNEILENLSLFLNRQTMSRIIFMNEMYQRIINVHGVAMEFGTRWGRNLAMFESFRGMYEPFNFNRKIVCFDTFSGFPSVDAKDGKADIIKEQAFSTTENYDEYLTKVLDYHEKESPISHIKKYEIVKGDATKTVHQYFINNPETIVAIAYFDFDIYAPTKECLVALKNHVTKGTVIGFDELNLHDYPGETLAFKEVFELDKYAIRRSPLVPNASYIVIE
ncbi:MAG: crotonobetainyl-CoA--carnitine CoA-transferase [Patescibacteria group bacterium]|jgi:hypothetical protein